MSRRIQNLSHCLHTCNGDNHGSLATGSGLEKEQKLKTGVQRCHDGPSVKEDIPILAMAQLSLWKRP